MTVVDPRLEQIPDGLLENKDFRDYFEGLERFLHDLWVRTGGGVDLVEDVEVSQIARKGDNRVFKDDIAVLNGDIAQLKRHNRTLEHTVSEVVELVAQTNRRSSSLDQKINELIERYDSGT